MKQKQVAQQIYEVKEEKDVYFAMRDGVRLAADVYRPDAEGKFPAIIALSGYSKDLQRLGIPPQRHVGGSGGPHFDGGAEAGNTDYIVSRGYAHVIANIRGTGYSEGESGGPVGKDGYDLVEAIANQPWCDGNIGMIGMSYFGVTQLETAIERPPHLRAICPYQCAHRDYRAAYDGGILHSFNMLWHGANLWGSAPVARNVQSAMIKTLPKKELNRCIQEARNNPDFKQYPHLYSILLHPERNPRFFDLLMNPTDGPFYWETQIKPEGIEIPVYCGAGLGAIQLNILASTFDLYERVKGPKKLMITDVANPDRPFHQWHDEFMRWYDYWLKGIDNRILDEPPIKRFVGGSNKWCFETEWPLARTKWTKFYLRTHNNVSTEPETADDIPPNAFVQEPTTVTTEIKSLKYVTPPLSEDTELAGFIALYLYASIDTDDTNWLVTLNDVNMDGSQDMLTRGFLKVSHRALDEGRSKPWRPYHPHTKAEPVLPGQVYEYAIEIQPISHVFKAGHRIGLEISSLDRWPPYHSSFHFGSSKVTLHKIYCSRKYPSYLLLPIIPKT